MARLKVGDVVKLKSGSPKMTVTTCKTPTSPCECQWFEREGLKHGRFPQDSLIKVEEADTGAETTGNESPFGQPLGPSGDMLTGGEEEPGEW